MNHFVYACIEREGGYVPKCMVVYSQGRSKKMIFLCTQLMNDSYPRKTCKITNKLGKLMKNKSSHL